MRKNEAAAILKRVGDYLDYSATHDKDARNCAYCDAQEIVDRLYDQVWGDTNPDPGSVDIFSLTEERQRLPVDPRESQ